MRTHHTSLRHGSPAVHEIASPAASMSAFVLEALPSGKRVVACDGHEFIRTNLICFGFCDLDTGQMCSARDICARHGGVGDCPVPGHCFP